MPDGTIGASEWGNKGGHSPIKLGKGIGMIQNLENLCQNSEYIFTFPLQNHDKKFVSAHMYVYNMYIYLGPNSGRQWKFWPLEASDGPCN